MNKKGMTIAEAVIAMVLLATVTMGIYGVIMAAIREGKKPDLKEDMAYAVESASSKLKAMIASQPSCIKWDPVNCTSDPNFCCLWDACLTRDNTGACTAWADSCKQETYTGSNVWGCARQSDVLALKTFYDLCGNKLVNNQYVVTAGTQTKVGAQTPFETGKEYHIDYCIGNFMTSPCAGASFFYVVSNIGTPSAPQYNIQFHLTCNGQTV